MPKGSVFDGAIAGVGSTSGVRVVMGMWPRSPLGLLIDLMIEKVDGTRILIAPSAASADFIASTYSFDEVRIEPTRLSMAANRWTVASTSAQVEFRTGRRTLLGVLLRLVPRPLARNPGWAAVLDPIARLVLNGVRTVGTAQQGRRETYCALDLHRISTMSGFVDGVSLGELASIDPAVRFGFGSVPPQPSLVRIVTVVTDRAGTREQGAGEIPAD